MDNIADSGGLCRLSVCGPYQESGTRLDQLQHLRTGLTGTALAIEQLQDGAGRGRHIALLCREAGFGVETGNPLVQGQTVIRGGSGRRGAAAD